jgi:hypothetical protein
MYKKLLFYQYKKILFFVLPPLVIRVGSNFGCSARLPSAIRQELLPGKREKKNGRRKISDSKSDFFESQKCEMHIFRISKS